MGITGYLVGQRGRLGWPLGIAGLCGLLVACRADRPGSGSGNTLGGVAPSGPNEAWSQETLGPCRKSLADGTIVEIVCGPSPYDRSHLCGTCPTGQRCSEDGTKCENPPANECNGSPCDGTCNETAVKCDGSSVPEQSRPDLPICCPEDRPTAVVFEDGSIDCCPADEAYPCTVSGKHRCCSERGHCNDPNCSLAGTDCHGDATDLPGVQCCDAGATPVLYEDGTAGCCPSNRPYPCTVFGEQQCCQDPGHCYGQDCYDVGENCDGASVALDEAQCCPPETFPAVYENGHIGCCALDRPHPCTVSGEYHCCAEPHHCNDPNCTVEGTDCHANTVPLPDAYCCSEDASPLPVLYEDGQMGCCDTQRPYPCILGNDHTCCPTPEHCNEAGCSLNGVTCGGDTVALQDVQCCPSGFSPVVYEDGSSDCCPSNHRYPCTVEGAHQCCSDAGHCNDPNCHLTGLDCQGATANLPDVHCCPDDTPQPVLYEDATAGCCAADHPYPCTVEGAHQCCSEAGHCNDPNCHLTGLDCQGAIAGLADVHCCPADTPQPVLYEDGTASCCAADHPYPCTVEGEYHCCSWSGHCSDPSCHIHGNECDGTVAVLPHVQCCSGDRVAVLYEDGSSSCCSSNFPYPCTVFGSHDCCRDSIYCNGENCYQEATDCHGQTVSLSDALCCNLDYPVPVSYENGDSGCCRSAYPYPCIVNGEELCCTTAGRCNE